MRRLLALPSLALLVGCAPISLGPPVVTDVPRGSETREVASGTREAKVSQDGLAVSVALTQHCTVARFATTERTITREKRNDAPALDWVAGLGGAFLVGSGITGVASPGTGRELDSNLSNNEVRGISYGLIAAGVALLAIPVIDHERSHGPAERKTARIQKAAEVLEEDRPCGAPPKGTQVFARFPTGKDAYLGATDAEGKLTANLDTAVGSEFRLVRGERAALHADGVDVGFVSVDALYTLREERTWKKLRGSACSGSLAETDCNGELAYTETFPEGDHVSEAKRRLDDARRRRAAQAEKLAFARLDLGACRTPVHADDSDPCLPLEAFRKNFPESSHATEVANALLAGRTARAKMIEAETKAAHEREMLELQVQQQQQQQGAGAFLPNTTVVVPYAGGRRDIPARP